jgi:hypothetical protein
MVPYLRTIDSSGTLCGDYYLMPRRPTTLIWWTVLDIIASEELELLSMLEALPTTT